MSVKRTSALMCSTCDNEISVSGSKNQPIYYCEKDGMPADDNPPYTVYLCYECNELKRYGDWDTGITANNLPIFICSNCKEKFMKGGNKMGRTFKAEEPSPKISTGHYTGTIVGVEYRDEPYEYTDFVIEVVVPGQDARKLKVGFASFLTTQSQLGEFVKQMVTFRVGDEIDIEKIAVGKNVEFDVINSPGKKDKTKTYSNIVNTTLKIVK